MSAENTQYNTFITNSLKLPLIAHIFVLASVIGIFLYIINKPIQNWDMLGYAASIFSFESTDAELIHNQVYQQLKAYATVEEYRFLTERDVYRETMYANAEAFYQQIPFYKIRILFVLLISVLTKFGINVFEAGHLVSSLFSCAGLLVFYVAYRKFIQPMLLFVIPLFFMILDIDFVARVVTADSFAFFWVALICYAFLNNNWTSLFILLATSVFIRTDLIVLIALVNGYLFFSKQQLRSAIIISSLASIAAYLFVNYYADNYGWSTVFYYAIVSEMNATHPLEYSSYGVSFIQYITGVIKNAGRIFTDPPGLLFGAMILLQFAIIYLENKRIISFDALCKQVLPDPIIALSLISLAYVILHYALFPIMNVRFFAAQYMIASLGFLVILSRLIENYRQTQE